MIEMHDNGHPNKAIEPLKVTVVNAMKNILNAHLIIASNPSRLRMEAIFATVSVNDVQLLCK